MKKHLFTLMILGCFSLSLNAQEALEETEIPSDFNKEKKKSKTKTLKTLLGPEAKNAWAKRQRHQLIEKSALGSTTSFS